MKNRYTYRRKCKICGNFFTTTSGAAKYCSIECRDKGRQLTAQKWKENNPGYMVDYMRMYRQNRD